MLWCSVAFLALFACAQGRAVNISNTWVLPEEGFPVFYRYFRDRISWYEADAVCQFHHANLVTVDTTAQYDAVRAYLKELDISSAVWVGLIRSNPDGDFTWTDYRGLSNEGYWSSAPDSRSAPLCAAADPSADYRWEARACGGPTVASFICELPVPQWALGNEGCMVRALPALTILYLPESAAVQLTADCGLAGVKRVQCTGNVKREDLLRDLRCAEDEELTTVLNLSANNSWAATADVTFTDQDTTTEITTEENVTTEHEDDINQVMTATPKNRNLNTALEFKLPTIILSSNTLNKIVNKNLDLGLIQNNNLQSNYIPKLANNNYLTNEQSEKIEDHKHMQHKMLHEEIARLGNLENIFTQPTDHFVPPLVMAKAKLSDDMTVLSLQEKHAQQIAEQHFNNMNNELSPNDHIYESNAVKPTPEESKIITPDKPLVVTMQTIKSKENNKKDKYKINMPKKYKEKFNDLKIKPALKISEQKPITIERPIRLPFTSSENSFKEQLTTPLSVEKVRYDDDSSIDLKVIIKEPSPIHNEKTILTNYSGDVSTLKVINSNTSSNDTEIKLLDIEATEEIKPAISNNSDGKIQNITSSHDVVKIIIVSEGPTSATPTVFEITTKMPLIHETVPNNLLSATDRLSTGEFDKNSDTNITDTYVATTQSYLQDSINISLKLTNSVKENYTKLIDTTSTEQTSIPTDKLTTVFPTVDDKHKTSNEIPKLTSSIVPNATSTEKSNEYNTESHEEFEANTNSSETIDDLNSPLLSGANEPLHRPNRSRRPQPSPNRNKFNPFRILG